MSFMILIFTIFELVKNGQTMSIDATYWKANWCIVNFQQLIQMDHSMNNICIQFQYRADWAENISRITIHLIISIRPHYSMKLFISNTH